MILKRITNILHPMYCEALKLYKTSFPYHEQREERSQEEIIKADDYYFDLIYDEDVFVGLILYWEQEQFHSKAVASLRQSNIDNLLYIKYAKTN